MSKLLRTMSTDTAAHTARPFSRVLVALDGSPRSECSLPWATRLAEGTKILLLRVDTAGFALSGDAVALASRLEGEARAYLAKLARRVPGAETRVVTGPAAETILNVAASTRSDLVVIATHGASPVRRLLVGGTAEKLVHGADSPLLVIPSWRESPTSPRLRRLLVPLDGSKASESIITLAGQVGLAHGASIVLAHVLAKGVGRKGADYRSSLRRRAAEFSASGIESWWVERWGGAPETLGKIIQDEDIDLVAMSAHGYGAVKRMLLGSVTSRLIRMGHVPVLIGGRPRPAFERPGRTGHARHALR